MITDSHMFSQKLFTTIFLLFVINVFSCKSKLVLSEQKIYKNEQVTGTVFHHTFHSYVLNNEREIFVWIPNEYHLYDKEYPLLIIHDGQNVFHPGESMSGSEWNLDESATEMINNKEIEPIIMVGVSNTKDRSLEYNPFLSGKSYGVALTKELLPELRKQYNISNQGIGSMGASMGGLISLYLGWELNSVFSMASCLSPAFIYNDFDYVSFLEKTDVPKNLKLSIVNGTEDLDATLQIGVEKFIDQLTERFFPKNNLLFWIAKEQSHNEVAWAQQSKRILKWMYKK